jgi:cyclophilin family peptidyl-prolyl cis-trans isomerase
MRNRSLAILTAIVMTLVPASAAESTARVTIVTTAGTFTARLLPEVAPQTVAQFLRLVNARVYDSVYFYRVEKGFVAQTADAADRDVPLTAVQQAAIKPLPLETSRKIRHARGVLSMAHGADPNRGETSFSLLLGDAPHLDRKFTIFGKLEGDGAALRALEKQYDKKARDKAGKRLQIVRITVER